MFKDYPKKMQQTIKSQWIFWWEEWRIGKLLLHQWTIKVQDPIQYLL